LILDEEGMWSRTVAVPRRFHDLDGGSPLAPSLEVLRRAAQRGALQCDRIVEAVEGAS